VSKLHGLVHRKLDFMIRGSKPRTSDAKERVKKIFKPQFFGVTVHHEVPKLLLL